MKRELETRLRQALASAPEPQMITALSRALSDLLEAKTALADAKARALAVLDDPDALAPTRVSGLDLPSGTVTMTCHEAMRDVLRRAGGPLSAKQIADEINRRRLYVMRDGRDLHHSQVHARANNYKSLFARTPDGRIALRRDHSDPHGSNK